MEIVVEAHELGLVLPRAVLDDLHRSLPALSERTITAIGEEIAEYRRAPPSEATGIERSVGLALGSFLRTLTSDGRKRADPELAPVLEAAHALGRGEAQLGRTIDGLLTAYRVGARIAWQQQSAILVEHDVDAVTVARYAQMIFEYIDELSSASAAGHEEERRQSGRIRDQLLERLALAIVTGQPASELHEHARRCDWGPPETLTAVLLRSAHVGAVARLLDPRTLRLSADLTPGIGDADLAVLLVPDTHRGRPALLHTLVGRSATAGPATAWTKASESFRRVRSARRVLGHDGEQPVDTEEHLATLVLSADPEALRDLRARVLAPLDGLRPATAERLAETLRSWLLHQGRRSDVAADLHIHPQTVRYRMNQLQQLFGDRLELPHVVQELVIALRPDEHGS